MPVKIVKLVKYAFEDVQATQNSMNLSHFSRRGFSSRHPPSHFHGQVGRPLFIYLFRYLQRHGALQ